MNPDAFWKNIESLCHFINPDDNYYTSPDDNYYTSPLSQITFERTKQLLDNSNWITQFELPIADVGPNNSLDLWWKNNHQETMLLNIPQHGPITFAFSCKNNSSENIGSRISGMLDKITLDCVIPALLKFMSRPYILNM